MSDAAIVQAELRVKIAELNAKVESLEKECKHFHRQFEMLIHHHVHVDGMVQDHEMALLRMDHPGQESPQTKPPLLSESTLRAS